MAQQGILVVGSANMDLVVTVHAYPRPGETIFGRTFGMFPGGKGANQAVCCAKLGAPVQFIGKMGTDVFRDSLVRQMKRDGVDLRHLLISRTAPTGNAMITVDRTGQNEIVVVSGSNMELTPDDVRGKVSAFRSARVVIVQLESPVETVFEALRLAKRHGAITLLNPAPARTLPSALLKLVDVLTPNETEIGLLAGVRLTSAGAIERAARILLRRGVRNVVLTLGSRGSLLVNAEGKKRFAAFRVKAVDTTAAGDAFTGGLAYSLARGTSLTDAIPFASAAAAIAVTRMGAQSSMPRRSEVHAFLSRVI